MMKPLRTKDEAAAVLLELLYKHWVAEWSKAEIGAEVAHIDPGNFTGELAKAWDDLVLSKEIESSEVSDKPAALSEHRPKGWTVIRPASEADCRRLEQAAARFCREWELEVDRDTMPECAIYEWAVTMETVCEHPKYDPDRARIMLGVWKKTVSWILGAPKATGIVAMTVGYGDMYQQLGLTDDEAEQTP